LTNPEDLLTGDSPICKCNHHVTEHHTRITRHIMRGGDTSFSYYCERCKCEEFVSKDANEAVRPSEHVAQDGVEFVGEDNK